MRLSYVSMAFAVVGILVAVVACGPAAPSQPTGSPASGSPSPDASTGLSPGPGVVDRGGGAVDAHGWVAHIDLEGGFWALVREEPATGSKSDVVVVLVPGQVKEAAIAALEGSYVRAQGIALRGASIRMAGPEMSVGSIEAVPAP